VQFGQTNVE